MQPHTPTRTQTHRWIDTEIYNSRKGSEIYLCLGDLILIVYLPPPPIDLNWTGNMQILFFIISGRDSLTEDDNIKRQTS